jgi:hypothetical protein
MLTGTVTAEIGLDAQYWGAGIARPVHDRLQGSWSEPWAAFPARWCW